MGRIRINAHSLNNEGTVGNVTEPRTIVLASGEKIDGISGEMLKHIHTEALWQLAKEQKVELCPACQILSPMKADANEKIRNNMEVREALNEALKCAICDTHGFLVQKPTLSRKSTIEFGWALALPNKFYRDIHVHTRVAPGEKKAEVGEQMIYNRPTRSGIYAFVSVFQPWRIGLNEIDYTYTISEEERRKRYKLVLEAYKAMLLRLEGAMTTTRLPHLEGCNGIIVKSKNANPVPIISPLVDNYTEEVKAIAKEEGIHEFTTFASLLQEIDKLKEAAPYRLGEQ
jgi:CRISPR-associated protein Cst2